MLVSITPMEVPECAIFLLIAFSGSFELRLLTCKSDGKNLLQISPGLLFQQGKSSWLIQKNENSAQFLKPSLEHLELDKWLYIFTLAAAANSVFEDVFLPIKH